jgi:hypothetical protein
MNERQLRAFWARFGPHYEADNGTNGGGGTGNGSQGNAGNEGNGGDNSGNGGSKVVFTAEQQAELDRILGERVGRAEKTAAKKALEARAKELGFESVEVMEAALKAHQDAQNKQKTDLEREQAARKAAEDKLKTAENSVKSSKIDTAIQLAAIEAKAMDPADVLLLVDRSKIDLDDTGKVTGAKEAVEDLKKKKTHLFQKAEGSGAPGNGSRGNGQTGNDLVKNILNRQGFKVGDNQQQQVQQPQKSSFWKS